MKIKIAGIKRKTEFSPNHVINDLLIINRTAEELQKFGAEVNMYVEDVLAEELIKEDYIFSMVQGPKGIESLLKIAKRKKITINPPESVLNCYRYNMVKLLPGNRIPFPKSMIIETDSYLNGEIDEFANHKFWLKRGDAHAVHKEDVTLVYNRDEAISIIREFNERDIKQAIIQEHLIGDTVKFYAIRGMNFFYWYHLNGEFHTPFSEEELKNLAEKSAEVLGLYVYGGDAIITMEGKIIIIDINDWPSFAPVREEACQLIAKLIYKKVEEYEK